MTLMFSEIPAVIKHGNGRYTIYRWFSMIFLSKPPFIGDSPLPCLMKPEGTFWKCCAAIICSASYPLPRCLCLFRRPEMWWLGSVHPEVSLSRSAWASGGPQALFFSNQLRTWSTAVVGNDGVQPHIWKARPQFCCWSAYGNDELPA